MFAPNKIFQLLKLSATQNASFLGPPLPTGAFPLCPHVLSTVSLSHPNLCSSDVKHSRNAIHPCPLQAYWDTY